VGYVEAGRHSDRGGVFILLGNDQINIFAHNSALSFAQNHQNTAEVEE